MKVRNISSSLPPRYSFAGGNPDTFDAPSVGKAKPVEARIWLGSSEDMAVGSRSHSRPRVPFSAPVWNFSLRLLTIPNEGSQMTSQFDAKNDATKRKQISTDSESSSTCGPQPGVSSEDRSWRKFL
jgi:hypothetical protein